MHLKKEPQKMDIICKSRKKKGFFQELFFRISETQNKKVKIFLQKYKDICSLNTIAQFSLHIQTILSNCEFIAFHFSFVLFFCKKFKACQPMCNTDQTTDCKF